MDKCPQRIQLELNSESAVSPVVLRPFERMDFAVNCDNISHDLILDYRIWPSTSTRLRLQMLNFMFAAFSIDLVASSRVVIPATNADRFPGEYIFSLENTQSRAQVVAVSAFSTDPTIPDTGSANWSATFIALGVLFFVVVATVWLLRRLQLHTTRRHLARERLIADEAQQQQQQQKEPPQIYRIALPLRTSNKQFSLPGAVKNISQGFDIIEMETVKKIVLVSHTGKVCSPLMARGVVSG